MKIFKMFYDFDKEETWLNQMAADGYLLKKTGFRYSFVAIEPGSATVRVDYRANMSSDAFEDYRSLFADAGWKHLDGSRSGGAQYFASFSGDADADIFSEDASKAQRYRRALGLNATLLVPFFAVVVALISAGTITLDSFLSPRDWYLTPGLWQMEGMEFARAFVFETPFVALRQFAPFLLVVACAALFAQIVYQGLIYRRALVRAKA